MYEDDTPPAERRAQALSLDRDLLRELLGQEELRELIDRDALAEVEASLRPFAQSPDHLHDVLRLRGDLRTGEFDEAHAAILEAERRAIRVRVAGEERLVAAEDAGRYRDALGVMPPSGLPDVFLEGGPDSLRSLVARYARGRGPFTTAQAREWFGVDVEPHLRELEREEKLVRGELRPGGVEREWCDPDVLRRLRRASLAALRREVEPAEQAALGRFLPHWHGIDRRATLREALIPLQGLALPVALWESDVLPRRVPGVPARAARPALRVGRARLGRGRVSTESRCSSGRTRRCSARRPRRRRPSRRSTTRSARRSPAGRSSGRTIGLEESLPALWDLVWSGEVTNDQWAPLRAERRFQAPRPDRRVRRFSRARAATVTATQGRWSLAAGLFAGGPDRRALAELLLERQGIVTRDSVRGEGIPGGYGAVYAELRALETLGTCRRGYFVEGLGGAQFALGGAVERLRELRPRDGDEAEPLVLAAADPAQPYGAALPWPRRAGARAARVAGAHVVLLGGEAALFVERGGRSLVPLREPEDEWLRAALAALVAHVKLKAVAPQAAGRGALRRRAGGGVGRHCRCCWRPASSPAPAAPCCAPRRIRTVPDVRRRARCYRCRTVHREGCPHDDPRDRRLQPLGRRRAARAPLLLPLASRPAGRPRRALARAGADAGRARRGNRGRAGGDRRLAAGAQPRIRRCLHQRRAAARAGRRRGPVARGRPAAARDTSHGRRDDRNLV